MINSHNVSHIASWANRQLASIANRAGYRARGVGAWLACITITTIGLGLPATCVAVLPDGRVYEEVSPANKNGNFVEEAFFGLAAENGEATVFVGSGAMGEATSSSIDDFVSRRSSSGWATSSAVPPALGMRIFTSRPPLTLVPSHDFSRFFFGAGAPYVSAEPLNEQLSVELFLSADPAVEPSWVGQPTSQAPAFIPTPAPGRNTQLHDYLIAGGTPTLSTVYFTYSGTLIPQDASRTPNVGDGEGSSPTDPWGFYEWSEGTLREAGVLPDGTLSPFGAVPAAIAGGFNFERRLANPFDQAQTLDNEISTDGARAFFMSPDPVASTSATPELYVRKTAPDGTKSTVLVSQSQLPGHEGVPASHGPTRVTDASQVRSSEEPAGATYVYASPNGSNAFFASVDQLTNAAPSDGLVKEYRFNVDTGSLTYLPGVMGPILVSSTDGSRFIFKNTATEPAELDLWSSAPGGGEITQVTPLPLGPSDIDSARSTADGSAFVFRTDSSLPGFNDGEGATMQVYRYETRTHHLDCVSCPPLGVRPSGDARVSYDNAATGAGENGANDNPMSTLDTRVISSDGSRVFFDTPDRLVSQDSNGKRDVYEWENGHVFLISSGSSAEDSFYLDSSASGDDVFFTTTAGLESGDRDGSNDVYDARVPRLGDSPPLAVPCQGDVCQGPPSVPSLLGAPPSALFNGAGNQTSSSQVHLTRAQKLAKALKACRAKKNRRKRRRCESRAKKAYGPKLKSKNPTGRGT